MPTPISMPLPTPLPPAAPYASDHKITIHSTTSMQGSPGAEFTVKCDLSFPESAPSSPSLRGEASSRRNRAIRIVFGSHPLPTTVTQLHDPSGLQLVHLKAQVPGWTLVATSASGNRVPVSVQVLLDGQEVVGSVLLGDYAYLSFTSGSRGELARVQAITGLIAAGADHQSQTMAEGTIADQLIIPLNVLERRSRATVHHRVPLFIAG